MTYTFDCPKRIVPNVSLNTNLDESSDNKEKQYNLVIHCSNKC
jgi:hypothetical protein